jgi:hypothetical protein
MRRRKPIRQINLRITEQLRARLEAAAAGRGISTNQLMAQLLEAGLENKNKTIADDIADAVAKRLFSKVPSRPRPPRTLMGLLSSQQDRKEGGDT